MAGTTAAPTVRTHFTGRAPEVRETYDRILDVARALGPVKVEAKKTSIHLVRRTAFAGVATRRTSLVLTLKSASRRDDARVARQEQASANRWHLEIPLASAKQVDRELQSWIVAAYALAV